MNNEKKKNKNYLCIANHSHVSGHYAYLSAKGNGSIRGFNNISDTCTAFWLA